MKTGEEVGFVVDAKTAGKGKVTCTILTPDGTEAEADVIENEDGTYDIFYTAAKPGTYVIYVRFGGVDIPNSPFTVMVSRVPSPEPTVASRYCNGHQFPSFLMALTLGIISRNTNLGGNVFSHGGICHAKGVRQRLSKLSQRES